ncbi:MAG: hypothetical protein K2Y71_17155 [Xanthobacteraceae bacterium]|nr:hypothetical protein [Xanthobacteraceae bacterium]
MAQSNLANLFVAAMRQLTVAADAFWRRKASVNEIDRLGTQEMTCLARDLGISGEELRVMAAQDKDAANLLVRRMETLRLDPARIDPTVLRDLQRCCSKCLDKGLCVHELEDHPRDPTWPKYCPNEQTLAALGEERPTRDPSAHEPQVSSTPRKPAD